MSRLQEVYDLSTPIRSEAHYADEAFKGEQLAQAHIDSAEFHDCVFSRCRLVEAVLHRCRFVGCTFQRCDLSLAQVPETAFFSTRFEHCSLVGIDWTQSAWGSVGLGDPLDFFESAISHSTFIGLALQGIQIKDCVAHDVDFREADLARADFSGTDLAESLFLQTNLAQADLSRARNYRIDPAQNVLSGARFSLPEAMSLLYAMDIVLDEGL